MKRFITISILSSLALGLPLILYLQWYLSASSKLRKYFDHQGFADDWLIVLTLSVLVILILIGVWIISFYYIKLIRLFKQQQNFLNGFTHELKTPIASLKIFVDTFLKYELSRTDQVRYLEFMKQDVNRLSENVNNMLQLSRIENKSTKFDFEIHDVQEIVSRIVDMHAYQFKKMEIVINRTDEDWSYAIHPTLFEMMIMNIISNAYRYNQSDMAKLQVDFKCNKIIFSDNGIGIAKKDLKNIFKKFYQSASGIKVSSKGSGIGLYLVQCVARLHGFRVRAESDGIGRGSKFIVELL